MWRELGVHSLRSGDYYAGIQMSVFPSSRQQLFLTLELSKSVSNSLGDKRVWIYV